MKLVLLFLFMCFLGGVGGAVGSMIGHSVGTGGVLGGGLIVGALFVVAAGYLAARWAWIKAPQRLWAILGGVFGFALAAMVTLATLSSPIGPILSTMLIGSGAVLGALVGHSAHDQT